MITALALFLVSASDYDPFSEYEVVFNGVYEECANHHQTLMLGQGQEIYETRDRFWADAEVYIDQLLRDQPDCHAAAYFAIELLAEQRAVAEANDSVQVRLADGIERSIVTYESYFEPLFQPGNINLAQRQRWRNREVFVAVSYYDCYGPTNTQLRDRGFVAQRTFDNEEGARSYRRPGNFISVATRLKTTDNDRYQPTRAQAEAAVQAHSLQTANCEWYRVNRVRESLLDVYDTYKFVLRGYLWCPDSSCEVVDGVAPQFVVRSYSFMFATGSTLPAAGDYVGNVFELTNTLRRLGFQ